MNIKKIVLVALAASTAACGIDAAGYGEGEGEGWGGGATQGGAQDIGFARQEVAEGQVPQAGDIFIEGLLSEHDLPVAGPACDRVLCVRPAVATAPRLLTGQTTTWVQAGMASGLPSPFVRPPVDLVVALDTGDTMVGDIASVEEAVVALIDHMRPDDNIAIVTFGTDITTIKALGPVGDAAALKALVRGVTANGPSPIVDGMSEAYGLLPRVDDPARLARVMVFACDYPDVSGDGSDVAGKMIDDAAARGIGTSYFGVLLGNDDDLATLLGEAHGGDFHFLEDEAQVSQVFDRDFDFIVTPIAYDLSFALELDQGVHVDALFGIPGGAAASPSFSVATAFPSHNHGAIVAALSGAKGSIGGARLSFRPEPALGVGSASNNELVAMSVAPPADASGVAFDGPGVRISVALVNEGEMLQRGCGEYWNGKTDAARADVAKLRDYLTGEAAALDDDGLRTEVSFVKALLANMR